MSPEEQKRLGAFLRTHSHRTARGYLGLKIEFEPASAETALEKRRLWAQAQQTNPKFQDEAIWILSNLGVLREALTTPTEELPWLETTQGNDAKQLQEADLYSLLGLTADASLDQIRDAHRLRYRDARHLKDRNEAHQIYAALDEAWRVLNDPVLREEYDSTQNPTTNKTGEHFLEKAAVEPPVFLTEKEALTQSPNLQIRGQRQLSFSVSKKIIRRKIRIERDGPGLVDATLRSDQPWLTARPERLEPHASSQDIHIKIDPKALPGQAALGQVIVKNFNGQRLAIHVKITKQQFNFPRFRWIALGLVVLLGGLLAAPPTRALFLGLPPETMVPPIIHLHVEPGPAIVSINNERLGEETDLVLRDLPADRPFVLRVEKEGHIDKKETIVLSEGQERKMTITLEPIQSQGDK
jgi:curved DNA-binding protein CbpA